MHKEAGLNRGLTSHLRGWSKVDDGWSTGDNRDGMVDVLCLDGVMNQWGAS